MVYFVVVVVVVMVRNFFQQEVASRYDLDSRFPSRHGLDSTVELLPSVSSCSTEYRVQCYVVRSTVLCSTEYSVM